MAKIKKAKPANEGDEKAKHTVALKTLAPIATEINVRFEKASKLDADASDHRLAAALRLVEAREVCETAGLKFKAWSEKNLMQSYETVRKLVAVGLAEDPKQALADMRLSNVVHNKAHREKQKAISKAISKGSSPRISAYQAAKGAVSALQDKEKLAVAEDTAKALGMKVVSKTDADTLAEVKRDRANGKEPVKPAINAIKTAFAALPPTDRMTIVYWVCSEVGGEFKNAFTTDDPLDIPKAMQRV